MATSPKWETLKQTRADEKVHLDGTLLWTGTFLDIVLLMAAAIRATLAWPAWFP